MAAEPKFHASVGGTVVEVNSGPCLISGGQVFASGANQGFLQMFNARATDVTLGTTTPDYVIGVSPGDNDHIVTGAESLLFSTACSIACTTTTTGSTARVCDVSIDVA